MTRKPTLLTGVLLISAMLLSLGSLLHADTLWISSGGGNPVPFNNVKVIKIEGDKIWFSTSSGQETSRELKQVMRMMIDGEAAFNPAEEAYAAAQWDAATDGYQKTIKSTDKDWLKDWCSFRLLESASKSGRFDAAVTAYIALVMKDPTLASQNKPALPDEKSTYLNSAVTEINRGLADAKIGTPQKQALLSFLLEIHRARKDTDAAGKVAEQLLKLSADNSNDPNAARALAELKLGVAHVALDKKDYDKVISEIDQNRALFTEPMQQADALYCLAEARYAQAQGKNDPQALKDAALDYMRVVAHFKDSANIPQVPQALMQTAQILEKLQDAAGALQLYQQVATEYNDSPAGPQAKENVDRLKAAAATN